MDTVFWTSWDDVLHTLIIGPLGYVAVIVFFRVSGKRTLSKFNSFDFVVTIAFGSLLASLMLNTKVSLAQGMTGIGLLVLLQWITTYLSTRSKAFNQLVKSKPSLLFYRGQFLEDIMQRERFVQEEIYAAIREAGFSSGQDVFAVVLETQGTLTVIPDAEAEHQEPTTLRNVSNAREVGIT